MLLKVTAEDETKEINLNFDIEYTKGITSQIVGRDVYMECDDLEAGQYYMFVEFDWFEKEKHFQFCATCYGE